MSQAMTAYLTRMFIKPLPIAIIMMDLYIQVIIIVCICFFKNEYNPFGSIVNNHCLALCYVWLLLREMSQMTTASYFRTSSNFVDLINIGIFVFMIKDLEMNSNTNMIRTSYHTLIAANFVAWIKLLFTLQYFIYDLAIFVHASTKVSGSMGVSSTSTNNIIVLLNFHFYASPWIHWYYYIMVSTSNRLLGICIHLYLPPWFLW